MTFDQEFLGMTPELEIILAEGAGMEPGYSSDKVCFLVSNKSLIVLVVKSFAVLV